MGLFFVLPDGLFLFFGMVEYWPNVAKKVA
jgi:hypothetical protein